MGVPFDEVHGRVVAAIRPVVPWSLRWGYVAELGEEAWRCACGAEPRVEWSTSTPLFEATPDAPITGAADQCYASTWELRCVDGHVLATAADLARALDENEAGDDARPPTTRMIGQLCGTDDDRYRWSRQLAEPKPS